jgi:hypothetical protein
MPTATTPPARPSDEPGAKEAPTVEATSSAPCYQRRAAADAAYRTAQDALDAARAGVASTKQALADAEAAAADTMAAAIGGDGASARTAVDKSRARVEKHVATSNGQTSSCKRPSRPPPAPLRWRRALTGVSSLRSILLRTTSTTTQTRG